MNAAAQALGRLGGIAPRRWTRKRAAQVRAASAAAALARTAAADRRRLALAVEADAVKRRIEARPAEWIVRAGGRK